MSGHYRRCPNTAEDVRRVPKISEEKSENFKPKKFRQLFLDGCHAGLLWKVKSDPPRFYRSPLARTLTTPEAPPRKPTGSSWGWGKRKTSRKKFAIEKLERIMRDDPGPCQFQTAPWILSPDWEEKFFVLFCPIGGLAVNNPLCVFQYKVHTQSQFARYLACSPRFRSRRKNFGLCLP